MLFIDFILEYCILCIGVLNNNGLQIIFNLLVDARCLAAFIEFTLAVINQSFFGQASQGLNTSYRHIPARSCVSFCFIFTLAFILFVQLSGTHYFDL